MRRRALTLWLVVLAVALRSLIAPGWMVAPAPDGSFSVVICTAAGLQTVLLDEDGQPIEPGTVAAGEPCPMGPAPLAVLGDAPSVASPGAVASLPPRPLVAAVLVRPRWRAVSARAPPRIRHA